MYLTTELTIASMSYANSKLLVVTALLLNPTVYICLHQLQSSLGQTIV